MIKFLSTMLLLVAGTNVVSANRWRVTVVPGTSGSDSIDASGTNHTTLQRSD